MLSFQQIKLLQRYLTKDAATTLVLVLVISHLGYCNSILYGIPGCDINKLQKIQNMSVKLVLKYNISNSATECNWMNNLKRVLRHVYSVMLLTTKI